MSRIHPACPDSGPSDRSIATVLLRQEPDEEEDGQDENNEEDDDEGYSE